MSRAWISGPGKVAVVAVLLAFAAVSSFCLDEGDAHHRDASMLAWCSAVVTLSGLGVWLAGPCATGRAPLLASLFAPAVPIHLLDPPPKLAVF
jgi:hypothetical protein